jgi:hypothetical protein
VEISNIYAALENSNESFDIISLGKVLEKTSRPQPKII